MHSLFGMKAHNVTALSENMTTHYISGTFKKIGIAKFLAHQSFGVCVKIRHRAPVSLQWKKMYS